MKPGSTRRLRLLAFELPQWKLRRLMYEDGEWTCSLSKESVNCPTGSMMSPRRTMRCCHSQSWLRSSGRGGAVSVQAKSVCLGCRGYGLELKSLVGFAAAAAVTVALMWIVVAILKFDVVVAFLNDFN